MFVNEYLFHLNSYGYLATGFNTTLMSGDEFVVLPGVFVFQVNRDKIQQNHCIIRNTKCLKNTVPFSNIFSKFLYWNTLPLRNHVLDCGKDGLGS